MAKAVQFASKHGRKPRTWAQVYDVLLERKHYLTGVRNLTLTYSKEGTGVSGARHFKYDYMKPIQYWNPDVELRMVKQRTGSPSVALQFENDARVEIACEGKQASDIMEEIVRAVTNAGKA